MSKCSHCEAGAFLFLWRSNTRRHGLRTADTLAGWRYEVNKFYKTCAHDAIAAISACKTTRFKTRNGLFRPPKRAVSESKTAHITNNLKANTLQLNEQSGQSIAILMKYIYRRNVANATTPPETACPHHLIPRSSRALAYRSAFLRCSSYVAAKLCVPEKSSFAHMYK